MSPIGCRCRSRRKNKTTPQSAALTAPLTRGAKTGTGGVNVEYTKEMILKLAEDLERCADPKRSCVGCTFDKTCDRADENGGAIFQAAATVIRWQNEKLEENASSVTAEAATPSPQGEGLNKGQEWQMGLHERAIEKWGELAQIVKAMEEMDELGSELARALLADEWDEHLLSHIKEELADVCIMTDQLQLIFGDVSDWEMHKLERLERKLERGL